MAAAAALTRSRGRIGRPAPIAGTDAGNVQHRTRPAPSRPVHDHSTRAVVDPRSVRRVRTLGLARAGSRRHRHGHISQRHRTAPGVVCRRAGLGRRTGHRRLHAAPARADPDHDGSDAAPADRPGASGRRAVGVSRHPVGCRPTRRPAAAGRVRRIGARVDAPLPCPPRLATGSRRAPRTTRYRRRPLPAARREPQNVCRAVFNKKSRNNAWYWYVTSL